MPEEIKYIDNMEKPKLNENISVSEIKPIQSTNTVEKTKITGKKISLPTWNIEPPMEIQRSRE